VMRSKSEAVCNKYEVSRLSGCSAEIAHLLLNSDHLTHCRARVAMAGPEFELQPQWANGALLLVPVTAQEIENEGLHLRAHHIVAMQEDQKHIKEALAGMPRSRKRPKLFDDRRPSFSAAASDGSDHKLQDEVDQLGQEATGCFEVVVEKTFVTVRSVHSSTSSGYKARSAP
jgi:hypothetical protein